MVCYGQPWRVDSVAFSLSETRLARKLVRASAWREEERKKCLMQCWKKMNSVEPVSLQHTSTLFFWIHLPNHVRLCLLALISQPFNSIFLLQQININKNQLARTHTEVRQFFRAS
jgi:hypothetical protein